MLNNKNKKHRTIQYVFKISTIIIICGLIVLLLPKIEGFKYSYQKGMPWKYETLIAPLDFPLHKSAEELAADVEKIKEEQAPIFNFKETNVEAQINKFSEKINAYRTAANGKDMDKIIHKLREIYSKGILLTPEKMDPAKTKNLLIVKNNIAIDEKFSNVYTLKQAYEALVKYIESLHLSKSTEEGILSIGLNNYINPNLEYDAAKTGLAIETSVKSITPTQGMVNRGDIIISKNEVVTPEKYKVLESFRIEHEQSLGSTIDRIRITVAQTVLTLIAIMSFSIFLYVSRKRLFYNNKDFFFLYSMFLLTNCLGKYQLFPAHQHTRDTGSILSDHREHIIRDKTGTLPPNRYELTRILLCSQQLHVLFHANIRRNRCHVQLVPPATPFPAIHRPRLDIFNLCTCIRSIHVNTGRFTFTEASFCYRVPYN